MFFFFALPIDSAPFTKGFKQVSVGKSDVWAITDGGAYARRIGISRDNPAGCGWDIGIAVNVATLQRLISVLTSLFAGQLATFERTRFQINAQFS